MTEKEYERLYHRWWKQINKVYEGGGGFGIDRYTISQGWRDALERIERMRLSNHDVL